MSWSRRYELHDFILALVLCRYNHHFVIVLVLLYTFLHALCLRLTVVLEVDADTIDTMSLVRWSRISLSLEDMSQMTTTIAAHNLRPRHSKCAISVSGHSSWHGIEECRPSTTTLELVLRGVERCVAGGAVVCPLCWGVFVVFAGEWRFGALFADDSELLYRIVC
jgi:hypothetical protein